jgi:hypothetical protein
MLIAILTDLINVVEEGIRPSCMRVIDENDHRDRTDEDNPREDNRDLLLDG